MTAKITLGKPPKTFAPVDVKFEMPDGTEGAIRCTFKYRSRKQFGVFLSQTFDAPAADGADPSVSDIMAAAVEKNGAYLVDVLDSWSLDEQLDAENAAQLADEYPAAARAIMAAYGRAVSEGRLGN